MIIVHVYEKDNAEKKEQEIKINEQLFLIRIHYSLLQWQAGGYSHARKNLGRRGFDTHL